MKQFEELLKTVRVLRSPKGCPWDRAQKIKNMESFLLEEVYELIDAIDKKHLKSVKEELGDIFLILVVITEMFRQKGGFNLEEVFKTINHKLISRHPHVFNSKKLKNKDAVLKYWIKSKAKQKKRRSIKERLPQAAPSLLLTNIFLKELTHLNGEKTRRNNFSKLQLQLENKIKSLKNDRTLARRLTDLIIDLSKIAFEQNIDLETQTRAVILEKAEKTHYCKND